MLLLAVVAFVSRYQKEFFATDREKSCESVAVLCLMLPVSWEPYYIIKLEANEFVSLQVFLRSKHFISFFSF